MASRAAVLASILPEDADQKKFLHLLGIHGNPVTAKSAIDKARRTGNRVKDPYGYERAFKYSLSNEDCEWLEDTSVVGELCNKTICDPTAGGGSIPFEASRLGMSVLANDLNPVAALVMKATVEWPLKFSDEVKREYSQIAKRWRCEIQDRIQHLFPQLNIPDLVDITYLWAHTVSCPYCGGVVPLSPNWRLTSDGKGVKLIPNLGSGPGDNERICSFEIVDHAKDQSQGTVAKGDGVCPYSDCGRIIEGNEIKHQAQEMSMGEQLYAVAYKQREPGKLLKSGKNGKEKWIRGFRAPRSEDDNSVDITNILADKLPEWQALDIVPSERIPNGNSTAHPLLYGINYWRNMFSNRQLLCHGTSVEVFRELLEEDESKGELSELRKAAYGYLAISIDSILNYINRHCRWDSTTLRVRSIFDRHDFAFVWSYAEMAPLVTGLGFDWAIEKTAKCIDELASLIRPIDSTPDEDLFSNLEPSNFLPPPVSITCKSGDSLDHVESKSIDAIVMDPPYYDNVMYAELSDFFYVWLKRTAGHVFPELFRRILTNKDDEAVANVAQFKGQKGAKALAGREYQNRMASIFAECYRILKPNGILTLMFTHKATGAWDALTMGLMEAGFMITASWPINTEAQGSLHIKNKAAANSTVFLVCRPRPRIARTYGNVYWEDVEPKVEAAVRQRIDGFQNAGITGVDLYLASFGPALEEFSRYWPLRRGTPRRMPEQRRKLTQLTLIELDQDPYVVTPEDALNAARREVKRWKLERLTNSKFDVDLDPISAFFVLAWEAFKAPKFSYDEALILARAIGTNLDTEIVGRLAEKKGSEIVLWDSNVRAAKGSLGPRNGSRGMIDAIHHVANVARLKSLNSAKDLIASEILDQDERFFVTLKAVLEVLPPTKSFTGIELKDEVAAAGNDFEVLYGLSRLAYSEQIDEPVQLKLWQNDQTKNAP